MVDLHVPALLTSALPAAGGRLGPEPEHFVVEELALYEASGEGEHLYVYVQKRGLTTQDLLTALSRTTKVRVSDIGCAGQKDKHAVTSQWLSLPASAPAPDAWQLPEGVQVLAVSRHKNKLRTGHLRANRFRLTLLDVPAGGRERAQALVDVVAERGLPNYYGPQRFGREGRSFAQAMTWVNEPPREAPQADDRRGRRGKPQGHFQNKLMPSVLQADVFNRYVSARLARPEPLLRGEVVRLNGSAKVFTVEDPSAELPRLQSGDIHLTGPMVGPKTVSAAHEAGELERACLAELGLDEAALARLAKAAPGTRRDLLLRPEELELAEPEPGQLVVSFVLPSGSYATQLVRELTHSEWLSGR